MNRHIVFLALFASVCVSGPVVCQTAPNCKIQFSVVRKDTLNNLQQGLVGDDLKWIQTKMAQKYLRWTPGLRQPEQSQSTVR